MAGNRTIQRLPRGLQDLLGMKGSGENPSELEANVRGVLDATPFYLQDVIRGFSGTTAVVAAPGLVGVTVGAFVSPPPGKLWLMCHVSVVTTALGAGEAYAGVHAVLARNQFSTAEISPNEASATGAAERIILGWDIPTPRVLQPNDAIGVYVKSVTAGAHSFTVQWTAYELTF